MKAVRIAKGGYVGSSIAFCVVGILLLLHPEVSAEVICRVMGILLAVWGGFKICGYLSQDLYRLAFQFDLACGILAVILGLLMVFRSNSVLRFLNLVLGIVVLTDGLLKIQTALDAKRFGMEQWRLIGGTAVLASVLGLMIILDPFGSSGVAGAVMLLGLTLLVEGLLNLCVAVYTIKTTRRRENERRQILRNWNGE